MRMNTDALVLRVTDIGESDRVITLLSGEYGIIRAFANGAKKLKSSRQSATQTLCYSRFSIYKSRDSYIIDDATCIESFFRLRSDIEKLSLAQYFCELENELAPEMDDASEYLRLILNCLHMLVTGKRSQEFLKAVMELRIMTLSGYMPALAQCSVCDAAPTGAVKFTPASGCISCPECSATGLSITAGVLNAMRHICLAPANKLFSFEMPPDSLKQLCRVSEKYLISQSGRNYKALDFYNRLFRQ